MTADPHHLARFVEAQAPVFAAALAELRAGRKRSHWMWFVFPQLRGLGRSSTAYRYGIADRAEAEAYLAHPVLGQRLAAATEAVLGHAGTPLRDIFGSPDDLKFRSSMTLFALASAEEENLYRIAVDRLCDGRLDAATREMLGGR